MSEFRNRPPEFQRYKENEIVRENPQAKEFNTYPEYTTYSERNDIEGQIFENKSKEEKKNRALASMSTSVVSAIAVAAFGITNLINVSMNAEFRNVEYVDGSINYTVEVEKMTESESLYAYLYEGENLKEKIALIDEDGDGQIVGSVSINDDFNNSDSTKYNYRLSLAGNVGLDVERKFDSYVVEIENIVSAFNSLSGECHCGIDGYYYFDMDFTDDQRIFDNFEATIVDEYGNTAECTFNDDLHSTQRIYVLNLKGSNAKLTLSYTANGKKRSITKDIKM